jgi:hypothetical protein
MTTTRSVCLSLELDFEGERVTGWLADEDGNDWAFSCWLDLLSVIDEVLAGSGSPEATTTSGEREVKRGVRKRSQSIGRSWQ